MELFTCIHEVASTKQKMMQKLSLMMHTCTLKLLVVGFLCIAFTLLSVMSFLASPLNSHPLSISTLSWRLSHGFDKGQQVPSLCLLSSPFCFCVLCSHLQLGYTSQSPETEMKPRGVQKWGNVLETVTKSVDGNAWQHDKRTSTRFCI